MLLTFVIRDRICIYNRIYIFIALKVPWRPTYLDSFDWYLGRDRRRRLFTLLIRIKNGC
jgi:hypothetical protein